MAGAIVWRDDADALAGAALGLWMCWLMTWALGAGGAGLSQPAQSRQHKIGIVMMRNGFMAFACRVLFGSPYFLFFLGLAASSTNR